MNLIQRLSNSLFSQTQFILTSVSVLAVAGTILELSGGMWDAISHILREPEFFWTIQHITVYSGVAMIGVSGVFGFFLLIKKKIGGNLKKGITIIIIGSTMQLVAGYGDSLSHDMFGIDGLVSWSHQPLETGLVLSSLGAFLILSESHSQKFKKFLPVSIMTLIFSLCWIAFNLSLLLGSTIQCLPFYEIFSSGCAVL